jgi:hypothetical protein
LAVSYIIATRSAEYYWKKKQGGNGMKDQLMTLANDLKAASLPICYPLTYLKFLWKEGSD